ncbi:MAG: FAD-binding oxidoreductase, partial [Dehalococcoidia bacterium]|nr:FAD-binding oxidoreductase [Dehalococcoidia bacterium]
MTTEAKTDIFEQLSAIVGTANVSKDPAVLDRYAKDQSLTPARRPNFVVRPGKTEEIQAIVKLANRTLMPVVPYSSGTNFVGAAVPAVGGILVDLSRMNKVLEIDTVHWHTTVEPGVTFAQLNAELRKHNLRVQVPLMAPPSASVLSTYLEREPVPGSCDFVYGNEMINDIIAVMPNGESFTMGNIAIKGATHTHPGGPGLDFYRLLVAAQGTMGIVYQMNVRLIPYPKVWKVFFSPFECISEAQAAIKKIQRKELGFECFVLNRFDLAVMLTDEDSSDTAALKAGTYVGINGARPWSADMRKRFEKLYAALPPWTLVMSIPGWARRPEEKVSWQENDYRDLASEGGWDVFNTVGSFPNLDKLMMEELLSPWRMQKKFGFKGTSQQLMFHALGGRIKDIEDTIKGLAAKHGYSTDYI